MRRSCERAAAGSRTWASSAAGPRSSRRDASASRSRRRSRRRPSRLEWCLPLVRAGRGGGALRRRRAPTSTRARRSPSGSAARAARGRDGLLVLRKLGPTPAGFPRRPGNRPETSSRLSSLARGRHRSTRLRIRRAASARRRPPSTSPPAWRGRRAGRSSSISTRRPTRRRDSASAPTGSRPPTCSTAPSSSEIARPTRFANLDLSRPSQDLAGAAVDSPAAAPAAYLADALAPARERYAFVFLDCPPSLGPLTVNALAAADRVLVPVQAEYYALEGLTQLLHTIERSAQD